MNTRTKRPFRTVIAALAVLALVAFHAGGAPLAIARIYFEYNSSANDLGVHVFLDAEDWRTVKIVHPDGQTIFDVVGKGGWGELGMTELFFEGAEPNLEDFPLDELLELFPEGRYTFQAVTVDGARLTSRPRLSHAIPAGPEVSAEISGDLLVIRWEPVTGPPAGFPDRPITIVGYQVIVGTFQVTVPGSATSVTVPPEYVASLASGDQPYEVLAIEASGNQTITEGSFVKP